MAGIQKATKGIAVFNLCVQPMCLPFPVFLFSLKEVGDLVWAGRWHILIWVIFTWNYHFCGSADTFGNGLLLPPGCICMVDVAGQRCIFLPRSLKPS